MLESIVSTTFPVLSTEHSPGLFRDPTKRENGCRYAECTKIARYQRYASGMHEMCRLLPSVSTMITGRDANQLLGWSEKENFAPLFQDTIYE